MENMVKRWIILGVGKLLNRKSDNEMLLCREKMKTTIETIEWENDEGERE